MSQLVIDNELRKLLDKYCKDIPFEMAPVVDCPSDIIKIADETYTNLVDFYQITEMHRHLLNQCTFILACKRSLDIRDKMNILIELLDWAPCTMDVVKARFPDMGDDPVAAHLMQLCKDEYIETYNYEGSVLYVLTDTGWQIAREVITLFGDVELIKTQT